MLHSSAALVVLTNEGGLLFLLFYRWDTSASLPAGPSPISCCEDIWRVGGWKALVARGHEAVMRTAVPCLSLGVAALCGGGAFPGPLAGSVRLTSSAALVAPRAANVCMQAYSDASAEPPSDFSGSAGFAAPTSTTAVGIGGAGGDAGAAAGGMEQQRWDDSSFDNSASSFDANMWDNGSAAPTAAVVPAPAPPRKPIETVNVGIVSGPYKRRRGYHVEVAVQHPGSFETRHRLWFGHEVLSDVAALRGRQGEDICVERFSESLMQFLKDKDVDLSDPDWGMADDSIPFSTEHLPLRTLFDYYGLELPEFLAEETLHDWQPHVEPVEEGNLGRGITLRDPSEGPFPCLGALPNPGETDPPLAFGVDGDLWAL